MSLVQGTVELSTTQGPIGCAIAAGELMKNSCTTNKKAQNNLNILDMLKLMTLLMDFEISIVQFILKFEQSLKNHTN
ncbi:MAG: hypothetical protein F6K14_31420 [Symploca sp. SIO2C1]|nr:hypothetical protein [Symploca sp. SIO2C1]